MIDTLFTDVTFDGGRHKVPDRFARGDAGAHLCGGEGCLCERQDVVVTLELGWDILALSRSRHHEEPSEIENLVGRFPIGQVEKGIESDNEIERRAGIFPMQKLEGIPRVGWTRPIHLDARGHEAGFAVEGGSDHRVAVLGGSKKAEPLVRRLGGDDEEDTVETGIAEGGPGNVEVGVVERVECAAKHPDPVCSIHGSALNLG
jgi:hypothetical protein